MFIPAAGFLTGSIIILVITAIMQLSHLVYMAIKKDDQAGNVPRIHIGVRYAVSLGCATLAICLTLSNVHSWMGSFLRTKALCDDVELNFEEYAEYGLSDEELELYASAVQMNNRLRSMQTTGWLECVGERELVRNLDPIDLSNFVYTPAEIADVTD